MTSQNRPQALVTGGSRGIGRAICIELAKAGFDVVFTYRSNQESSQKLISELCALGSRSVAFQLDLADPNQILKVSDEIQTQFPQIEALINNAGMTNDGLMLRYKLEDFNNLINTNLRGPYLVTQAFLRPMMKLRRGSIVFISSLSGQMGIVGQTVYSSTKAGLFGLTKSLAKEIGSRGIRVNAVAPGYIRTDMTESLPQEMKQSILAQIPLGSFGEPEDIAKVVTFLVSPASRYITGEVLAVNGGLYM